MSLKCSVLDTQIVFSKVFAKGLKLRTLESRGLLFTAMAEYYLYDKEPEFDEESRDGFALSLIFEDIKEGADVSLKKYSEGCYGKYGAELRETAKKLNTDTESLKKQRPEVIEKLRHKHFIDVIEGDKAAVQRENSPESVPESVPERSPEPVAVVADRSESEDIDELTEGLKEALNNDNMGEVCRIKCKVDKMAREVTEQLKPYYGRNAINALMLKNGLETGESIVKHGNRLLTALRSKYRAIEKDMGNDIALVFIKENFMYPDVIANYEPDLPFA